MDKNHPDQKLWRLAQKRAAFKKSLASYFVVNSFLCAIWFVTSGPRNYFWPVWPILGWGFGIALQYFGAYAGASSAEEEFKKLKGEN
jgi:hypothetical protein